MTLTQWAIKHGVGLTALNELRTVMGEFTMADTTYSPPRSEASIQTQIRLEGSRKGVLLWRNNVGAYKDDRGNFVRYGLANETAAMNKKVKSSDLIGIRPVLITPAHVGSIIGQFVAREVKKGAWKYTGNAHELAQSKFIHIVNAKGGDARFVNREGTI